MHQESIQLIWTLPELPALAAAQRAGALTMTVAMTPQELTCRVYYDFRETPLVLCAVGEFVRGDRAELILMPHRIELYVNGKLQDEEWPAGTRLFDAADAWDTDLGLAIKPYIPSAPELPAVLGTFTEAEGWRPGGGVFVGDCMPYVKDDTYHVLYLKDRRHHKSKWGFGAHQWEHISTKDFHHWQIHPTAVEITEPYEGSICTGSWMACEGREYLFYTVRMSDRSPAHICRSVSEDGFHFRKDKDFCFTLSDKYHGTSARDPKVICGEDGRYHMFLTTSLTAGGRGCLAHLTSRDLGVWQEEADPIYISADETQPECPDYISYGGRYYLICSLHGKAHYLIADAPFGPWREPKNPIIPCHSVPKGGVWEGKIVFTGFRPMGGYAGTMTFAAASADGDGELLFETVCP